MKEDLGNNSGPPDPMCFVWRTHEHGGWDVFFGDPHNRRPSLPDGSWERVDMLFEQVAAEVTPDLFIVLTESSAEDIAQLIYTVREPSESVVIAHDYIGHDVVVWAHHALLHDLETELRDLRVQAERLLRQHEITEALVFSIQSVSDILRIRQPATPLNQT